MVNYKKPSNIIPVNDETRIERLHGYEILDTNAETGFDTLAKLAAGIFETGNAFISFVDRDMVFFKANISSMPNVKIQRADSLCALTILEKDATIFKDTHQITEFIGSPYLSGADTSKIRFYAAMPIITADGLAVGAIGVTDTVPHMQVSERQIDMLKALSALVMEKLDSQLATRKTTKANDEILHRLVHDLKSPMTTISLYTQLLESKEMPAEKVFGIAVKIQKSLKSMQEKLIQLFIPKANKNADS